MIVQPLSYEINIYLIVQWTAMKSSHLYYCYAKIYDIYAWFNIL